MKRFVIAITGASGVCYGKRLFDCLKSQAEVHVIISERGAELLNIELGLKPSDFKGENVTLHKTTKINTSIASGSFQTGAMVVCPCSGSTMSGIARAAASNLIQRAAEVHLKEHRKLVLVPRETPLSVLQLENMHRLAMAGAVVLPAMPGWYHGVDSLDSLVDFVVSRILDQLEIENSLMQRWGE